jgi:molecular chaperone GrpE
MRPGEENSERPVIRDRRRIDPVTGQVRESAASASRAGHGQRGAGQPAPAQRGPGQQRPGRHSMARPGGPSAGRPAEPEADAGTGPAEGDGAAQAALQAAEEATARLAERTADLQRLQAEYANYRKRVERDRMAVREQALANVLTELLPVLDDIGRAREHGELVGGFKSVAESIEAAAVKLGLTSYGEDGDPFDPRLHEALMHSYSGDVTEATCVRILQPGYKVADRILRPARVAVEEPWDGDDSAGPGSEEIASDEGVDYGGGAAAGDHGPRGPVDRAERGDRSAGHPRRAGGSR